MDKDVVYQYILEYYTTTKRHEVTGPGGEMVTTTECEVGRAVNEPELLNHEETKREAESSKERGGAHHVKKDYSEAYRYYAQIRFLKNASCYGGRAAI